MVKKAKNIGVKVKTPKEECEDNKCPFHGDVTTRGRVFTGIVLKKDVHRTATVEWSRRIKIAKYERLALNGNGFHRPQKTVYDKVIRV